MANTPVDILDSEEIEFEVREDAEPPIIFGTNEYVSVLDYPRYSGSTQITPTSEAQTLTTENTVVRSNIVVDAVPSQFIDISDTTAIASDVSSGKFFYTAEGIRTEGAAASVKVGVLRPDAELVERWTYDKYIVQDEGVTLPTYTTSNKFLKASSVIFSQSGLNNASDYDYCVLVRGIATPEYSIDTKERWRIFCTVSSAVYEVLVLRPSVDIQVTGLRASASSGREFDSSVLSSSYYVGLVYTDNTHLQTLANTSSVSGPSVVPISPSFSNNNFALTVNSPRLVLAGSSTGFSQVYYDALTDIRYQYIVELWRMPKANAVIRGFGAKSQLIHTISYINGGTLT